MNDMIAIICLLLMSSICLASAKDFKNSQLESIFTGFGVFSFGLFLCILSHVIK